MSNHHEVIFLAEGKRVRVSDGTTLLQAARVAGVSLEVPCDGHGTCGKCRVHAIGPMNQPSQAELQQLGQERIRDMRFACQTKVFGTVQVRTNSTHRNTFVTLDNGQRSNRAFNPSVSKQILNEPTDPKPLSVDFMPVFPEHFPAILQELAATYNKEYSYCEAIMRKDQLLDLRYHAGRSCLGLAVDIGTTSVVAELFDLGTGKSLGVKSTLNPQVEFGGDVLTRIAYASRNKAGTQHLQKLIVDALNCLIKDLTITQGMLTSDIYEVVIAGNTTMLHLLLGVNPRSLAHAPYRPVFLHGMNMPPVTIGLHIAPRGMITVLPSAAAFVGADIVAGLLSLGLHARSGTALFIDIGTNGEIVVCKNGLLIGTSAAAGPALEGMNIACGCRAEDGAIESVRIEDDGAIILNVIGNTIPRGICGSGLIDIVSELVRAGVIENNGRFARKEKILAPLADRLITINGQMAFILSADGPVFLSQKDIRQVQLAKGAIVTAIELLLKELSINYADIDEILVAGAFGFHLKPESITGIGLFPHLCQSKISFVGNTAKEGAISVLLDQEAGLEITKIANSITINELSLLPEFQDYFVRSLGFPSIGNTVASAYK